MTKANQKSTPIEIAPLALRNMAVAAMIDAGMGQGYSQPIADGAYDLEHLRCVYRVASGRQRGMDGVVATVSALGAWARVYPVTDGLFWNLDGGIEVYAPREGVVIRPPTGQPFRVVGSACAAESIRCAINMCLNEMTDEEEMDEIRKAGEMLLDMLAHRDHLHAQVGDLQATNTRLLLEAREARAELAKGGGS